MSLVHVFPCSWTHSAVWQVCTECSPNARSLQSSGGGGWGVGGQCGAEWRLGSLGAPHPPSTGWVLRMWWTGLQAAPPTALPESLLSPQGETQPASFSDPQEPWLSLSPPPWPAPDLAQLQGRASGLPQPSSQAHPLLQGPDPTTVGAPPSLLSHDPPSPASPSFLLEPNLPTCLRLEILLEGS